MIIVKDGKWKLLLKKTTIIKFSGNVHKCKTNFFYRENMIENVINNINILD